MIVVNPDNVGTVETKDEIVGKSPVWRKELMSPAATGGPGVLLVTFENGARLNFHAHDYEQILIVTEGSGIVATHDEERRLKPGDVAFIAPGEVHWHGAVEGSSFSHICIQKPGIRLAE